MFQVCFVGFSGGSGGIQFFSDFQFFFRFLCFFMFFKVFHVFPDCSRVFKGLFSFSKVFVSLPSLIETICELWMTRTNREASFSLSVSSCVHTVRVCVDMCDTNPAALLRAQNTCLYVTSHLTHSQHGRDRLRRSAGGCGEKNAERCSCRQKQ